MQRGSFKPLVGSGCRSGIYLRSGTGQTISAGNYQTSIWQFTDKPSLSSSIAHTQPAMATGDKNIRLSPIANLRI
jgi:hypothetical protein